MEGNEQEKAFNDDEVLQDPPAFVDLNSVVLDDNEDLVDSMPDAHPEPKPGN